MTVLFVCTGNTCRSPMAAGLFNAAARAAGLAARGVSRGLAVGGPDPATPEAVHAAAAYGADISGHRAAAADGVTAAAADHIYAMTRGHLNALARLFPDCVGKMDTLAAFDIADPYGGSQDVYDEVCRQIADAVDALAARLGRVDG
ncbi:MAG: low molecular weight protein arginine phosphatase [Oscillospiraceae bacterium]|jgi:protein-tyrosine-phosphatase|nr:low molecular weight protein arginine phosphatase [Oscillospiraceae bacterium]